MQTIETCKRCGRPLKDAKSIKRGYGPKCYKKAVEGIQTELQDYIEDTENKLFVPMGIPKEFITKGL